MLGGIEKIIKTYFSRLINVISDKIFMNAILRDLFYVKHRKEDDIEGILRDGAGEQLDPDKKKLSDVQDSAANESKAA